MLHNNDIKKEFTFRVKIIFVFMILCCCVLLSKLYDLQILQAQKYNLLSDKNRIRVLPLLAKRGNIISSDKAVVAFNVSKYKLVMESQKNIIFDSNIEIIGKCIDFSSTEIEELRQMNSSLPMYNRLILKDDLTWEEYSKISLILFRLKNVYIDQAATRKYLFPIELSHVTGYAVKSGHLQNLLGKSGIEYLYDHKLCGKLGNVQNEINALGKRMRVIESNPPLNGDDIFLTINADLQKYIYDLIADLKSGACVVINIKDGSVLALVSVPGFDSNMLSSKITQKQWLDVVNDPLKPLMNKAISCIYPPGSIFKIVVAFAALSENVVSAEERILCDGGTTLDNHVFHCWNRRGHGCVNLLEAIRSSCDCYFYEVSKRLGIEKIVKYAKMFGFGDVIGIDLPNEVSGLLPSKAWKMLKQGKVWKPYETILVGIGQGAISSTLMQLAVMMCRLYTNNADFIPHIVKDAISIEEDHSDNSQSDGTNSLGSDSILNIVKSGLHQVCNHPCGTAYLSCNVEYAISGKTASCQTRRIKDHEVGMKQSMLEWIHRDHAFFVGCGPNNDPHYVVAVFIDHGGGGSSVAAPIARKIFDKLMGK